MWPINQISSSVPFCGRSSALRSGETLAGIRCEVGRSSVVVGNVSVLVVVFAIYRRSFANLFFFLRQDTGYSRQSAVSGEL